MTPRVTAAFAVLAASLAVAPAPARALTGRQWRPLLPLARAAYVTGVVDAWNGLVLVQESLGSRDRAITVFADVVACVRDRPLPEDRVAALVEAYVDDNPGQWGKEMTDLVFAALTLACR